MTNWWIKHAITWGPVVIAFNGVIGSVAVVKGRSMQPTLNPEDSRFRDRVILDKASVQLFHRYKRGQVVVLSSPEEKDTYLIKRLIGIEGDWVLDRKGQYVHLPRGMCWIEGDAPAHQSQDSDTVYGPVPLALIQARVVGVVWPPHRIQSVSADLPPNRVNSWSSSST